MQLLLSLLIILLNHCLCQTCAASAVHHQPTFVLSPLKRGLIPAYYDSKNICDRNKRTTMASTKDTQAYHSMISTAVDFTDIYVRNGYLSGNFSILITSVFMPRVALISSFFFVSNEIGS